MLIVYVHALQTVNLLDLAHEVILQSFGSENTQDVVRVQRPVHERFARFHVVAVLNVDMRTARNVVFALGTVFAGDDDLSLTL